MEYIHPTSPTREKQITILIYTNNQGYNHTYAQILLLQWVSQTFYQWLNLSWSLSTISRFSIATTYLQPHNVLRTRMRPVNEQECVLLIPKAQNYCPVQHQDGAGNYKFPLYTPPKTENGTTGNWKWLMEDRSKVFHPITKVWTLTEVQHKLEHRPRSRGPTLHLRGTIIIARSG
jgi:hypothetical protein